MRLFGRFLTLLCVLVLSEVPMGLVQGYAWASMIVERAPEMGLGEALEDTFSGESPCEICCALAEVRERGAEQEGERAPNSEERGGGLKVFPVPSDAGRGAGSEMWAPFVGRVQFCQVGEVGERLFEDVPTPPPRGV